MGALKCPGKAKGTGQVGTEDFLEDSPGLEVKGDFFFPRITE